MTTGQARHREYDEGRTKTGYLWVYLGPTTTNRTARDNVLGYCDDTVGNRDGDNALTLRKVNSTVAVFDGAEWYVPASGPPRLSSSYTHCPSYWQPAPKSGVAKYPNPTESDLLALAPQIVAKTNPSAPHIGTPQFVGELRDIPGGISGLAGFAKIRNIPATVRNWGQMLIQLAANGYISWRWAVRPMISDIDKMLSFRAAVEKRFKELDSLVEGNEIRKRCYLGTQQELLTENVTLESQRATCYAYRDTLYRKREWATVRWRMNEITSESWIRRDRRDLYDHARNVCRGFTSQEALSTLWELLPWSWFYDWFGNVGQVIAATNNSTGTYPVSICLMRRIDTWSIYRVKTKSSWLNISTEPEESEITKRRWIVPLVGYTIPTFALPTLGWRQWSILASLAALKGLAPIKANPAFKRQSVLLSDGAQMIIRSHGG